MDSEKKYFYSNGSEITMSGYDISARFIRTHGTVASGTGSFTAHQATTQEVESVVVSMSPSHAKAMIPGFVMMVLEYEQKYGSIPLPKDAMGAWTDMLAAVTKSAEEIAKV